MRAPRSGPLGRPGGGFRLSSPGDAALRRMATPPAGGRHRHRPAGPLSDQGVFVLAVAAGLGAWAGRPVPLVVAMGVVAAGAISRKPVVLVLAVAVLASCLGARSLAGLGPARSGPYTGTVTLLSDPSPTRYGTRVDVRVGSRHLELDATGAAAGSVAAALTGERLAVSGRVRPPPPGATWLVPRHVVGRLAVDRAERVDAGAAPWRAANRLRRLLGRGVAARAPSTRDLYLAFVVGDDRNLRPEVVDDFRGSGLSHVLVVSGQNLAFLLILVGPLVRRLRLGTRWLVLLAVIATFATVTRFEPSVLRASAMATVSVTAAFAGRPATVVRRLSLAVTALVLVDPLLVRAVGFQLSVAACTGLALLAEPIARRLPGPEPVREALGASVAAQLGVAPVLVAWFGGIPVVGLVANPIAVPAAGLVTTWGLPAGLVAGVAGPGVGRWLHLPTALLVGWVAGVARISSALPLGELDGRGIVLVGGLLAALLLVGRHQVPLAVGRRVGASGFGRAPRSLGSGRRQVPLAVGRIVRVALVGVLLAPGLALRHPPPEVHPSAGVVIRRPRGATEIEVAGRPDIGRLLEALRRAGVRRIDELVTDRPPDPDLIRALRHRWPLGRIVDRSDPDPDPSAGSPPG